MIFAIEFKKYVANTSIFSIIIAKLYYKKKSYSIILFKVNKNLKIGLYYTFLFLNLIIYLQIKGDKEFLLNTKKIT